MEPRARRTLLITGGTGFLGRELALALGGQYAVVLTGRNNQQNMEASRATGCPALPMDVTGIESVRDAFAEARPDVVVHAAATKYVDLAERQPMECVDVNVRGSQNVARVCVEKGVSVVIGMSTDKAAPPVANTYGLTKALMERIFCGLNAKTPVTRFACVRHGNIAWSTGSAFPTWRRMQETTGLIESTGADMTRFFSRVDEAVALVRTAIAHVEAIQGGILVREMKAARIRDILDVWVATKGGRWERIEARPGERPHEFLIGEAELPYASRVDLEGAGHYLIRFNRAPAHLLDTLPSSETAARLSDAEIAALIATPVEGAR